MTLALLLALAAVAAPVDRDVMACRVQCPARPVAFAQESYMDCAEECRAVDAAAFWRAYAVDEEPRMQLIVTPRVCLSIPGDGCLITATVLIHHPGEKLYCPKVEFRWAEGFTSSVESDCPPYDQLEPDEREWFRLSSKRVYGPGEHPISVVLSQGEERALLTRNVVVR
jgi:hypothetical protein